MLESKMMPEKAIVCGSTNMLNNEYAKVQSDMFTFSS